VLSSDTNVVLDRSDADIQDLLPVPGRPGRYLLIDSKGEQLVVAIFDGSAPTTVGITTLWQENGRSTPSWGVWLD